jgi:hypothetical protein
MNFNELIDLMHKGYVTDTTLLNEIEKNPELLDKININDYVSAVVSPVDSKEEIQAAEVTYEKMFLNALLSGGAVLNEDLIMNGTAIVTNKTYVNLNGKTISGGIFAYENDGVAEGNTDSYAFWVKDGGELTINDEGNLGGVKAQAAQYSIAVWAQGGKVIINGGRFINDGVGSDLIYASAGGKVIINGGEFYPCEMQAGVPGTANKYTALNIKDKDRDTSSIIVYGGKFYNFNPANNLSEGPNTSFVAEGYESVEVEKNVWEVRKIDSPVVVEEVEQPKTKSTKKS